MITTINGRAYVTGTPYLVDNLKSEASERSFSEVLAMHEGMTMEQLITAVGYEPAKVPQTDPLYIVATDREDAEARVRRAIKQREGDQHREDADKTARLCGQKVYEVRVEVTEAEGAK
jgi:hypothetical protein